MDLKSYTKVMALSSATVNHLALIILLVDPIEYKLQLDLPNGYPSHDDGTKSDISGLTAVDRRIELVKDTHPLAAYATMDHLDDSLDSSASRHHRV